MEYKRIHVRVPISGEAQLSTDKGSRIKALAIDISQGGVAITDPSMALTRDVYDIVITTADDKKIALRGELIRQTDAVEDGILPRLLTSETLSLNNSRRELLIPFLIISDLCTIIICISTPLLPCT